MYGNGILIVRHIYTTIIITIIIIIIIIVIVIIVIIINLASKRLDAKCWRSRVQNIHAVYIFNAQYHQ